MISWGVWDVKLEVSLVSGRKLPTYQDLWNGHRHPRYDPINHFFWGSTLVSTLCDDGQQ